MLWFQGAGSGLTGADPPPPGLRGQDSDMAQEQDGYHLYGDLAEWWALISPPEEYGEEAAFAARVLGLAAGPVREVLELGSGGGHNASYLSAQFTMTLVDASPGMLA